MKTGRFFRRTLAAVLGAGESGAAKLLRQRREAAAAYRPTEAESDGRAVSCAPPSRTGISLFKSGSTPVVYTFRDHFEQRCSLQESSLSEEHAIWFGVDRNLDGRPGCRMIITRTQMALLLPHLRRFAETGSLDGRGGGRT